MANIGTVNAYIDRIVIELGTIVFDGSPLSGSDILDPFEKSSMDKPNTKINVFNDRLKSERQESRLQKRSYMIAIRIHCRAEKREKAAQDDLQYLEEQITIKLENLYNDPVWAANAGHLENSNMEFRTKNFNLNWFSKELIIPIITYNTITV